MTEGQQQLCVQVVLPEDVQEVKPLLSLLHSGPDVKHRGVVSRDVGATSVAEAVC